jgi:hypothetical protein
MAGDDDDDDLYVDLGLEDDASPLEFLMAVYRSNIVPINLRVDAAKNAAMYVHPKLIAVAAVKTGQEKLMLSGGLPNLPGANVVMPKAKVQIEGEVAKKDHDK